jgi:hypothetical protein
MVANACGGMSSLTVCFKVPGNKLKTAEGSNHTVAISGPKIYNLSIACYNDEPLEHFFVNLPRPFMYVTTRRKDPTPRARARDPTLHMLCAGPGSRKIQLSQVWKPGSH